MYNCTVCNILSLLDKGKVNRLFKLEGSVHNCTKWIYVVRKSLKTYVKLVTYHKINFYRTLLYKWCKSVMKTFDYRFQIPVQKKNTFYSVSKPLCMEPFTCFSHFIYTRN